MRFPSWVRFNSRSKTKGGVDKDALATQRLTYIFRMLATECTVGGTLRDLAKKCQFHESNLSRFMREGRVPQKAAEHMEIICCSLAGREIISKHDLMYPLEIDDESEI